MASTSAMGCYPRGSAGTYWEVEKMKMILWIDYDLSIPIYKWSLRGDGLCIEKIQSYKSQESAIDAGKRVAKKLGITITRIK